MSMQCLHTTAHSFFTVPDTDTELEHSFCISTINVVYVPFTLYIFFLFNAFKNYRFFDKFFSEPPIHKSVDLTS